MISEVTINDVGLSDHSLIKCKVAVDIKRQPIIRASFRNWKKLDLDMFKQRVCSSSAYLIPATTASNPVDFHLRSSLRRSCFAASASADNHLLSGFPRLFVLVQMGARSSSIVVISVSS